MPSGRMGKLAGPILRRSDVRNNPRIASSCMRYLGGVDVVLGHPRLLLRAGFIHIAVKNIRDFSRFLSYQGGLASRVLPTPRSQLSLQLGQLLPDTSENRKAYGMMKQCGLAGNEFSRMKKSPETSRFGMIRLTILLDAAASRLRSRLGFRPFLQHCLRRSPFAGNWESYGEYVRICPLLLEAGFGQISMENSGSRSSVIAFLAGRGISLCTTRYESCGMRCSTRARTRLPFSKPWRSASRPTSTGVGNLVA